MRLTTARVQKYRSIRDTGWFNVDSQKTILVGPNEAGKTAVLQALSRLNPPEAQPFDPLRDYPRAEYDDIPTGKTSAHKVRVVEGHFSLDAHEREHIKEIDPRLTDVDTLYLAITLDNERTQSLVGGPTAPAFDTVQNDLARLAAHVDKQHASSGDNSDKPSDQLTNITKTLQPKSPIAGTTGARLAEWLRTILPWIDEDNERESRRHSELTKQVRTKQSRDEAVKWLLERLPVFVYFSNYYRVRPNIHLEKLAERSEKNLLEDQTYDFGNLCLLRLLGFSARELSDLGKVANVSDDSGDQMDAMREKLDRRRHRLNAASVSLTRQVQHIWQSDDLAVELHADQQYLNVLVRDEQGSQIELDQRSEGFQWCVSFWIVFRAQASDQYANSILLLDEPGLSLHGLKQSGFRETLTNLSQDNQLLYTTHSPFLVGADELDMVRVVEMVDRATGTVVHNDPHAEQSAALLPLQEALGYDLAHTLFTAQRNLVLEGLTDFWYVEAVSEMMREAGEKTIDKKIVPHPAGSASKLVYYATILHASKLKVAALLDADSAGDQAAQQDTLVHQLGNRRILRTADAYDGPVKKVEIEDLSRDTLVQVARNALGWDISQEAHDYPKRPIVDILSSSVENFSKYHLAKAFIRWSREHTAADLTKDERKHWSALFTLINKALK